MNKIYYFAILILLILIYFFIFIINNFLLKNQIYFPAKNIKEDVEPETVIVLHGIGKTNRITYLLAKRISEAGFEVYNISYPSKEFTIQELADFLKQKKDSEFIFVSIHDDLLRKTMKVKPIAFVRKDFIQSDLDEAVENFLKEYAQKKKTIAFQDGKRLVTFPLRNIIYFYSEKDYVVVCLDNEDLEQSIRQKLDSIDKKMKPYEFLRIHNRYLINLRRIKKLHNFRGKKDNAIEMDNGRILPVSQKYVDLVRESIYEWFHQGNT